MNNVPSSAILTVAGVIAAMLVIGFGYMFLSTQKTSGEEGNKKVAEVNTAINDNKYTQYDGKTLRGSDVLAAIEYFTNDDISVAVNNGKSITQYVRNYNTSTGKYEPFTGETSTVPKTEDEAKRIAGAKNKMNDSTYINPSDLYSGSIIRSNSTNEVMQVVFSVESGSSYQRPQDNNGAGNDTPVTTDKYTITYDPNGGTGSAYNYIADKGANVTILSNNATQFNKENYSFIGWSKDQNATTADPAFAAGATYTQNTTENVRLYAVYTRITYTISYNSNGGNFGPNGTVTKDGIDYTISNGGTTITQSVGKGDTNAKIYPEKPTKPGYNFAGYATSPSSTTPIYQPGDAMDTSKQITLYAIWTNKVVKIHYDANGGVQNAAAPMQDQNIQVANPSYLNSNTYTREDYTFAGWSTTKTGTADSKFLDAITFTGNESYLVKEMVNGKESGNYSLTLYAVWTRTTQYSVSFNLNKTGATWTPGNLNDEDKKFPLTKVNGAYVNQNVNGIFTFNSVVPTCNYYTFVGWNTKADGTGETFYPGSQASITKNTDFYGVWKETQSHYYIRSFLQNPDGSWPTDKTKPNTVLENYNYGTKINVTIDPPTGYIFDGGKTGVREADVSQTSDGSKFFTVNIGTNKYYSSETKNGETIYYIDLYYKTETRNITFFAQAGATIKDIWVNTKTNKKNVTVTGNNSGTVSVPYGSTIGFTVEIDKNNGYIFNGWTSAETESARMSLVRPATGEDPIKVYDDTSITATTRKTNTPITYIMNGGTHAGYNANAATWENNLKAQLDKTKYNNYKTLYKQETGFDPNEYYSTDAWKIYQPYRFGYTFLGWKSASPIQNWSPALKNGKIMSFTIPANTTGAQTFEALWGITGGVNDTWSVSYKYVDGNNKDLSNVTVTGNPSKYTTEDSFTLQAPSVPGYTFTGWSATVGTYTGEVLGANGLVTNASIQGKAIFNNAATATTTLTTSNPVKVSTGSYGPIVFTAHFTKRNDCKVYFSANGSDKPTVTPASVSGAYGAKIVDLIKTANNGKTRPTAERTGYTVEKWVTDAGVELTDASTMPSEETTYRAKWKPNTYTIKYNANGGAGTIADQKMTYDSPANLTTNAFTRTGYTFLGWSTIQNGDVVYADKEYVSNLTTTNNGTVTLYARWANNTYNVKYDLNGGTPNGEMPTVAYYDKAFTVKDPSKTGYIFTGWTIGGNAAGTRVNGVTTFKNLANAVDSTVTLKANWTTTGTNTKVTVQFMLEDLDNNTGSASAKYSLVDTQYLNIDTGTTIKSVAASNATTNAAFANDTLSVRNFSGYTYSKATFAPDNSKVVRADGTTIVTVYYVRAKYTLTFAPEAASVNGFSSVSFTTSYNHNGAWNATSKNASAQVYYGETVTLNSEVKHGFTLGGYKQGTTTLSGNTFIMPAQNTNAYVFVKNTSGDEYKITYTNMDGAENKWNNPTSVRGTSGNVNATIGPMYKRGYHVSSFELTSGKATAVQETIKEAGKTNTVKAKLKLTDIQSDLTIMVHWEPNQYTIQYVDDSGTNAAKTVDGYTYDRNDNLASSDTFKRNGYELVGWSINTAPTTIKGNDFEGATYTASNGYYKVGQTKYVDKLTETYDRLKSLKLENYIENWKYNNTGAANITEYTDSAANTVTLHAVWKALPVKVTVQDLFVTSDYLTYQANHTDPTKTHASTGSVKNSETYAFYPGDKISADAIGGKPDKGYGGDGINNAQRTVTTIEQAKAKMGNKYEYVGCDTKTVASNGDTIIYRYYKAKAKVQVTLPNNKYGISVSANDVYVDAEFAVNAANEKIVSKTTSVEWSVFSGQYVTVKNIVAKNASYLYSENYGASVTYGMIDNPLTAGFAQGKLTGTSASGYSVRVDSDPIVISVNYAWDRFIVRYHVNGGTTGTTKRITGMRSIVQHRAAQSGTNDTLMLHENVSGSDLYYDMYVTRGREDKFTFAKPNKSNVSVYNEAENNATFQQLVSLAFTKNGYTFAGWNTKADGTGDNYKIGSTIPSGLRRDTMQVVNLYAQWTKDGDGGVTLKPDPENTITNENSWSAYVIVKVSIPVDKNKNLLVTYTPNTNWKKLGEAYEADADRTIVQYYGYTQKLAGGATSTAWKKSESVNNTVLNATSDTYASVGTMAYAVSAKNGMTLENAYEQVKRG